MTAPALEMTGVTLAYDARTVVEGLDLAVPEGAFSVIVGPNGCGKSTVLRGFARLLSPRAGAVRLAGRDLADFSPKELARELTLLPQSAIAPEGITVRDLVARGRYAHQRLLRQWSRADAVAVDEALAATATTDLAERFVEELSGGQRQRVWVAMALAQQSRIILLDEPTTFLDVAHQYGLLDLFAELNAQHGRTIVAVLHDLNQAARYASQLVVMKSGAVVACGDPHQMLTAELVGDVFDVDAVITPDPTCDAPQMTVCPRRPLTVARSGPPSAPMPDTPRK